MPPQLTETWASAYLQILIGTLVFALGIPAFILQLVVHEDIRHVTERRMKTIAWKLSIFLLGTASILFVWYLHPQANDEVTEKKKWIASLIVTLIPLAVGFLSFRLLGRYKREKVIDNLKRALIKEFEPGILHRFIGRLSAVLSVRFRAFKGVRPRLRIKRATLEDFIFLGGHSKAGYQKELVLRAYKEVAKAVQRRSQYRGEELKELVQSLIAILKSGEIVGNEDNYYEAAELLAFIRENHSMNQRYSDQDADSVSLTLTELGLETVRSRSERTALKFLYVSASCNQNIVFKMGLSALRSGRFLIATIALNMLEAEVQREARERHGDRMKPSEASSRLLGLLSHFVTSGDASRRRAHKFFSAEGTTFYDHLKECLAKAFDYHYDRTDFDTADKVAALLSVLEADPSTMLNRAII